MICHYRQFRSHPIYRLACNSDHGIDSIHMKSVCTESLRKLQIYFRLLVELQVLTCASTSYFSHKPKPSQNFIFWLFCNSGMAGPIWFWNQNFEYIRNPYHQEYWDNFSPNNFLILKTWGRQGKEKWRRTNGRLQLCHQGQSSMYKDIFSLQNQHCTFGMKSKKVEKN